MRVATPVSSGNCEIVLKIHPVDPVLLETYVNNMFSTNRIRVIGKPMEKAKKFLPKVKHFEKVNLFWGIAGKPTCRCFL